MANNLSYIFLGGFAKGYRTYILMAVVLVGVAAGWALGDIDTATAITQVATALGLGAAAVHEPRVTVDDDTAD